MAILSVVLAASTFLMGYAGYERAEEGMKHGVSQVRLCVCMHACMDALAMASSMVSARPLPAVFLSRSVSHEQRAAHEQGTGHQGAVSGVILRCAASVRRRGSALTCLGHALGIGRVYGRCAR